MHEPLPSVLVCVTGQKTCERLILMGKEEARRIGANLWVVHVARPGEDLLGNPDEGEALEFLLDVSRNIEADMAVLRSHQVVETLAAFARDHQVVRMIMGKPVASMPNTLAVQLTTMLPEVVVDTINPYKENESNASDDDQGCTG